MASVIGIGSLLFAAPAYAQETRAEVITAKQAEKTKTAKPYQPSGFERIMTKLEENFISPPNGFYPQVGTIPQGGGFSAGVGYRQFFGPKAVFDARGAYSMKNYLHLEVAARRPWHRNDRTFFEVRSGYLDAPQVAYFGTSTDSGPRTSFRLKYAYGAGRMEFKPTSWTRLYGEASYDQYETFEGKGKHPSIETGYDPFATPGLFKNIKFARVEGQAAIDWRTSPAYSRKGGFYGVTVVSYNDGSGSYGFQRMDGEVIQHLPILRENWVISVRGRVQSIVDDDDTVPFFLLPSLGSGRTLRAYETTRFRDRHSLLTSAEFRWIPNRFAMDMALFYDAGKVTNRREDLDFENLTTDWGLGVRFHAGATTVLRIEGARGNDGWRLVFSTGAAW
jgi:outer membrane protein assembly factor BamA